MTHTYYLGRDNERALTLKRDGEPINHLTIARWLLLLTGPGAATFDSDADADVFSAEASRVVIELGAQALEPGFYRATLIAYSADHPSGVVWGGYTIHILPNPTEEA